MTVQLFYLICTIKSRLFLLKPVFWLNLAESCVFVLKLLNVFY